jgi:alkanesulfonate monooxygenase SsuD/methylene tetrahydromethanopterin reductase-like flavin-dependent oxidoreductase (luciferase family)
MSAEEPEQCLVERALGLEVGQVAGVLEHERFGYARYWFAEHHLNPGVAGTSPAVVLALTAAATSTIRIGSGAVQLGNRTALSTVEEFGLIDALHPGRLDLGLGRSGRRSGTGEPSAAAAGKPCSRTVPRPG